MSEKLVRAFNLTVSPREDISDEIVKYFRKWIEKSCKYYYCVVESETSKRHLHASMFFTEPKDPRNMKDTFWKKVKTVHTTSIGRVCVHIQAMPGEKWLMEYLQKEQEREIVCSRIPLTDGQEIDWSVLNEYIPSEEVQKVLMDVAAKKGKASDPFYSYHEVEYKNWLHSHTWVSSTQTAAEYFGYRMFEAKDMRVIADSRRVHQMSVALHKYATDCGKLTNKEISMHAQENMAVAYDGIDHSYWRNLDHSI